MLSDLRFAVRQLIKSPGFAFVAILTLALGIGANTAIFGVLDHLLTRPLPVTAPQRLAILGQPMGDRVEYEFNFPLYRDYQRENTVFTQLSATADQAVGLGTGGATERQRALLVSGNYFTMLGVDAALGRTFAPNEGVEIEDAAVVVLSHGLWERRFGADPQVIGRSVTINGQAFSIAGVAPREFAGTTRGYVPDLYIPITMYSRLNADRPGNENPLSSRFYTWHQILGRLKDGVTAPQAQAEMQLLAQRVHAVNPANTQTNLVLLPGAQGFVSNLDETRLPLRLLAVAAGLVLLIACANLANLQLARALSRSRDFAIRLALGAKRVRLVRQLLSESVVLAVLGGGLGLVVAVWLTHALEQFRPHDFDMELSHLDLRVLAFTFLVATLTGILFGLAPAWRASRPELLPELAGGASTPANAGGRWNLRGGLVVVQIALSLVVLVAAGLCVRSLQKLERVDPGFEPSRVMLSTLDLGLNNYTEPQSQAFFDQLLERVRSLPGVEAASLSKATPLDGNQMGMSIDRIEGYEKKPNEHPSARLNMVSGDFFRTCGIRLLSGREFSAADAATGPKVVIVNEAFAKQYWPGQNALGKRLYQPSFSGQPAETWEVVGVVGNAASRDLQSPRRPTMFRPTSQWANKSLTLAVRTGIDPAASTSMLRALVKSMDANVPVFEIRTLEQQRNGSLSLQRMVAALLGGFGFLALALAALGIYGVLAYAIGRRTREIGIRMALGAQIRDVVSLVLRQGLGMVGLGLGLGLAGAFAATGLLRGFLYNVQPIDPLTYAGVTALLLVAALLACFLPARRAAKVDPMEALRHE